MKKPEYEAPKFEFHELQLVERVANKCWGAGKVWVDTDDDGKYDIIINLPGNGCSDWEEIFETELKIKDPPDNLVNIHDKTKFNPIFS